MRVLLADDRRAVRSALRLLLEQEPGVKVVGEAADATGLLNEPPEKVLMVVRQVTEKVTQ
jgi:DNA-binding NarL/FixJ family response regulator